MQHVINWFEIPASDFDRATKFYGTVLGSELQPFPMGEGKMAFFPMQGMEGVGGALVTSPGCVPSADGAKVYFDCGADLQPYLDKVEPAGGKVIIPKTLITDEIGYFGAFIDTEGNMVCLHSNANQERTFNTSANWFEIPVVDFEKSVDFYTKLMGADFYQMPMGDAQMAFFPMEDQKAVGGALVKHPMYKTSVDGTRVYLNGGADLQEYLDGVVPAGGEVVIPKTLISEEHGYFAHFKDVEGNIVGLHSMR